LAFYRIFDILFRQQIDTNVQYQAHESYQLIAVINLIDDTRDLQQTASLRSLQRHSAASSDCQVTLFVQTPLSGVGLLFRIASPLNYNSIIVYYSSYCHDSLRTYKKCRQRTIILYIYIYFLNFIQYFTSLSGFFLSCSLQSCSLFCSSTSSSIPV
jgi:hypothetical protein